MSDFGINEMLEMQGILQDTYKDKWEAISPETGKNQLLWMGTERESRRSSWRRRWRPLIQRGCEWCTLYIRSPRRSWRNLPA